MSAGHAENQTAYQYYYDAPTETHKMNQDALAIAFRNIDDDNENEIPVNIEVITDNSLDNEQYEDWDN